MRVHALLCGWFPVASSIFGAFLVGLLLAAPAQSQTTPSGDSPAPTKWGKMLPPQADANGDGVLTINEAKAFRKGQKKGQAAESGTKPATKSAGRAEGKTVAKTGGKAKAKTAAESGLTPPTLANVRYGPHERDVLDLWKAKSDGPTPVLIFFHGGSFKAGDKSVVLKRPMFGDCLEAGVSVVSANYRFSSDAPYPASMLDGARAVQFVRSKAKEWGIDPSKVALSGSSAGATMALWIALHDDLADPKSKDPVLRESTRVCCVAAYSGPSTIAPEVLREQGAGVGMLKGAIAQLFGVSNPEDLDKPEIRKQVLDFCPLTHATKDDPPLYVSYQGDVDEKPSPGAATDAGIHDVRLGMPLKKKYDALGLDFQIFMKSKPLPPKGEIRFLMKQFKDQAGDAPGPQSHGDESRPAALLFQLDFEQGFQAKASSDGVAPTNENLPALVEGVQGKAAQFGEGQALRYLEPGQLNKIRGAISMWVRPAVDGVGEAGEKYYLFAEEGRGGKAYQIALYMEGDWEIRLFQDVGSEYLHIPQAREWRKGEWHHQIVNWDAERGDIFAYLDGRAAGWGRGSCLRGHSYDHTTWKTRPFESFVLGAKTSEGANPWRGAMDEVRIFDRPMTEQEARTEYLRRGRLSVEVEALDRYLYTGKPASCRLVFDNRTAADANLTPRYAIRDASGKTIGEGAVPAVSVKAGQSQRVIAEPVLPAKGTYTMMVTFEHEGRAETRIIDLMGLAPKERGDSVEEKLSTVMTVDAVHPSAIAESAPSRVVESPLGAYREAGAGQHDRFALAFDVKDVGQPHLAVIAYPDDKPRTMEVVLQNLDGVEDRQMQVGFSTGKEYPLSNTMLTQRLLFWPKSKRYALIFMTAEDAHPAALQGITIQRMENGLPPAPVQPFSGDASARRIGVYFEDPVIPKNYGGAAHFPGFADTIDRMLDYMDWFGQDILTYPVVWYRGPIYKSRVEPFSPVPAVRPHPQDYPEYLMRRLAARGMGFLPVFALHEIPSLSPLAITDMERVVAGEETTINVRCDDTLSLRGSHNNDSDFNPLDPRIQQRVKELVGEFLDLYGDEPALTGVMILPMRHKLYNFGSSESGYNDMNLRMFQQETGLKIPVDPKDPKRFSKSYEWLKANAWEKWLDWRCGKLHDYYKEIADLLTARRPELKLVLGLLPRLNEKAEAQYLPQDVFFSRVSREAGVDVRLFAGDKNIECEYLPRVGSQRWMRARGKPEFTYDSRTMELAPEITAPIANLAGSSYVLYDRYWENAVGENNPMDFSPIAGSPVAEIPWRVSAFNPNSFHCLEDYSAALNNLDAVRITKGGFVVGTLGIEPYVERFAQAYRALPAVRFGDVESLSDPVRVRQKAVEGRNYFYVLNRLPVKVDAELTIAGNAALTDLVSGKSAEGRGMLSLALEPYDLRVFRADTEQGVVTGGQAKAPAAFVSELERRLGEAETLLAARRAKGEDISGRTPYLERARELMKTGQYARLYFSLQEDWGSEDAVGQDKNSKALAERAKKKTKAADSEEEQ